MGNCFPCTVPLRKSWKTKSVAAAQDNAEARGRGARITRDGNPFNERFTVVCCSGLALIPCTYRFGATSRNPRLNDLDTAATKTVILQLQRPYELIKSAPQTPGSC